MVIHGAIRVAEPVIPLDDLGESGKKALAICVIRVDGSKRVAAAGYMIKSTRKCETQGSCHIPTLEEGETMCFRLDPLYVDSALIAGQLSVPTGHNVRRAGSQQGRTIGLAGLTAAVLLVSARGKGPGRAVHRPVGGAPGGDRIQTEWCEQGTSRLTLRGTRRRCGLTAPEATASLRRKCFTGARMFHGWKSDPSVIGLWRASMRQPCSS